MDHLIIKAIFAGVVIMFGCGLYLTYGGLVGAFLFSVGLLAVVQYKLNLFTGKVGLLSTKQISVSTLVLFLALNFIGVLLTSLCFKNNQEMVVAAQSIITKRLSNGFLMNLLKGIGCGVLVTCGVAHKGSSPALTIMSVMAFILLGFNHCIADFGYWVISGYNSPEKFLLVSLFPTIVGNSVGGYLCYMAVGGP